MSKEKEPLTVKEGDIVEFLAISWDAPHWEFDHPVVLLEPVLQYSPNGDPLDALIEDTIINLSCEDELEDEDITDDLEGHRTNLKTLRKVAKTRLAGDKSLWKTKFRSVMYQRVQFILNEDGELEGKILESKEVY